MVTKADIPPRVACYFAMMNTSIRGTLVRDYLSDLWRQALFTSLDYYRRPCTTLASDIEALTRHAIEEDSELASSLSREQMMARKAAEYAVNENEEEMNKQLLLLKEG